jgi:hypothetical protein
VPIEQGQAKSSSTQSLLNLPPDTQKSFDKITFDIASRRDAMRILRRDVGVRHRAKLMMLFAFSFIDTAAAQVIIPFGGSDNDTERYLVAGLTLAVLAFAMWRYFRNRR